MLREGRVPLDAARPFRGSPVGTSPGPCEGDGGLVSRPQDAASFRSASQSECCERADGECCERVEHLWTQQDPSGAALLELVPAHARVTVD